MRRKPSEKIKYIELSANTVAFISYRRRLTKVLACAARGEREVRVVGPSEAIECCYQEIDGI